MSTSDILILSQTIILGLTAVIVMWYTIETYKIRKETSRQNMMVAEQLLLMQQTYKFEKDKQISFIEPILVDQAGSHGENWITRRLINKGATIKNADITPRGQYSAKIDPAAVIASEEECLIKLDLLPLPIPDKLYFELHYENQIGIRRTKTFAYMKAHGKILESQS